MVNSIFLSRKKKHFRTIKKYIGKNWSGEKSENNANGDRFLHFFIFVLKNEKTVGKKWI